MTGFGIITWAEPNEPIRNMGEVAKSVENHGFDSLWIWDTPLYTKDAYTALTVAALSTDKIRLGPGVSNPVSRDLCVTANAIATLDDLSEGRAVLGFGNGGHGAVQALGHTAPGYSQFREYLKRLCTLMDGKEVAIDEKIHYSVNAVHRRVPIYIASAGPRTLQLTGELVDGVLLAGSTNMDILSQNIQHVRQGARTAGRSESEVKINIQLTVSCHSDPQTAIDDLKPIVAYQSIRQNPSTFPDEFVQDIERLVSRFNYRTSPSGFGSEVLDIVPDKLVKHLAIAGTETECLEHLKEIIALAPDEITFRLLSTERERRLTQLASLVSKAR